MVWVVNDELKSLCFVHSDSESDRFAFNTNKCYTSKRNKLKFVLKKKCHVSKSKCKMESKKK